MAAMTELFGYFAKLVEEKRKKPGDDLVSLFAHLEVDGERIPEIDVLTFCLIIVIAGNETTRNGTTGGMLAFIEHPDEMRKLVRNPKLLDSAVEEVVRWISPIIHFGRTAAVGLRAARQDDPGRSGAGALLSVGESRRGDLRRTSTSSASTATRTTTSASASASTSASARTSRASSWRSPTSTCCRASRRSRSSGKIERLASRSGRRREAPADPLQAHGGMSDEVVVLARRRASRSRNSPSGSRTSRRRRRPRHACSDPGRAARQMAIRIHLVVVVQTELPRFERGKLLAGVLDACRFPSICWSTHPKSARR